MINIWYVALPTKFKMMPTGPKWETVYFGVLIFFLHIFKYLLKYENYGFPVITYV